ncbi:hypothetical protein A2W24_05060 [Microgenomates group bacterium RBG_16_45_19]|nr:MAG: hypothetical protein A2W24_05060 [Microgenomates group bacterium RBG_16_45_19]
MPQDLVEPEQIRLYRAPMAVVTAVGRVCLLLILFWALKHWIFTLIYDLSGWKFAQTWAEIDFLFWPAMFLAGIAVLIELVRWQTAFYDIFPDRLVIYSGLLSRYRRSIDMDQFVALELKQGWWGRLLGYGSIVFLHEVIGTVVGKLGVTIDGVRNPEKLVDRAAVYVQKAIEGMTRGKTSKKTAIISTRLERSGPDKEPVMGTIPEPVAPPVPKTPIAGEINFS